MKTQSISSPEDQNVTFVELFFDLVFVFSVTQVVSLLHGGLDRIVVGPTVDVTREREALKKSMMPIVLDYEHVQYQVRQGDNVTDTMQVVLDKDNHNLVTIGASQEWRIRSVLFGSIPDIIAGYAHCAVLMVRRYLFEH